MYSFKNDYSEGCHPSILQKIQQTNMEQLNGYGEDKYCEKARKALQNHIKNPSSKIYFVSGGTQANAIIISSLLRPHESVITAHTGHINVHEAGAIEATGHKVEAIQTKDGKLTSENIEKIMKIHSNDHHMTKPKMIYISNSTEVGTIYSKREIESLSTVAKKHNLYLFLDGARLGSALVSSDLTLEDIARRTDVFYIGGTKNGALIGEAIVINTKKLQNDFLYNIKQKGGLLAKGRLLGVQFLTLFENNLFYDLASHANKMAQKLKEGIQDAGYQLLSDSLSNQIFPILPNNIIDKLKEQYSFYIREKIDEKSSAIRLVTSRATQEEQVKNFIKDLQ